MALAYLPDDERHRVIITVSGDVRVEQLVALLDLQVRDGTWNWPVIYDGTRRTEVLSTPDVHALAVAVQHHAATSGRRGPVAIVRDTDAGFAVARMFSMLSARHTVAVKVFRDRPAADEWLDALAQRPVS